MDSSVSSFTMFTGDTRETSGGMCLSKACIAFRVSPIIRATSGDMVPVGVAPASLAPTAVEQDTHPPIKAE